MIPERFGPVLAEVRPLADRFAAAGHQLYLVGGLVRDLLLGPVSDGYDIDLTTDARPDQVKRVLNGWADAVWTQGERFGTIGARPIGAGPAAERTYEITTFRSEVYRDDSRKPNVTFSDDIDVDLGRRDFTVNAMALELTGGGGPTLVDPFDGAIDLVSGILRTPLAPEISFEDDPLRMLRAARFIARYGLEPVPELVAAVVERGHRLGIVSAERIRDELDKLIVVDHPAAGLWFAVDTGLAEHFLPELPGLRLEHDPIHRHKDVLTHTIAVIDNVRQPEVTDGAAAYDFRRVRLAALFHDVGKPRRAGTNRARGRHSTTTMQSAPG